MNRRRAGRLAGVLWVGLLAGCSGGPAAGDPNKVVIVSSLPRTGSAKGQTDTIVHGIEMALDEAGHKAGPFALEYRDLDDATASEGKWTAEQETANADRSAKDPDVMAYIGPYNSGAAKVSIPVTNRAGLLMVSPAVTWPGMTKPGKGDPGEPDVYRPTGKVTFTRVVPADDIQAACSATWAKNLGVKKVVVLDDGEVYGKGIATLFRENCLELKIAVVGDQQTIDTKQNDFRALMSGIKAGDRPDLIYFGGTTQTKAGQIAKDMVAAGLGGVGLMVPDGCYELAFIQAAGADAFHTLKAYVTFGGLPPDQLGGKGKAFVDQYRAKYGKAPEGYAIYGYEAGKVAVDAIARAGKKDRAAVLAAALATKDFQGALGAWSFDANGDTTSRTMSGSTVKDGAFVFVARLDELGKK